MSIRSCRDATLVIWPNPGKVVERWSRTGLVGGHVMLRTQENVVEIVLLWVSDVRCSPIAARKILRGS